MSQITEKTIDINEILKGKMGAKAKYVPAPVVSWLKKIAHQDEVNKFLWDSRELTGTPWLEECVRYLDMTLE
ncbi:MAG: glycerol acyltransferase, partial [Prevotella sp.]|nr:glycerol acyltransferase [Prevotella sp.]